jgi:hypothetical protein
MNPTDLVHWTHMGTGASGHAHKICLPQDGTHKEVPAEDPDWVRCIGKPGICDWCGHEGTVVK